MLVSQRTGYALICAPRKIMSINTCLGRWWFCFPHELHWFPTLSPPNFAHLVFVYAFERVCLVALSDNKFLQSMILERVTAFMFVIISKYVNSATRIWYAS
ncbi:hypothetical protein VPH35_009040 [Triticum aestivum]